MQCCGADTEGLTRTQVDALTRAYDVQRRTCFSGQGTISELCRVRNMLRSLSGSRSHRVADEAQLNYWVNDWVVVGPSATIDSFTAISSRLADYRAALSEVGITTGWMHFYWAVHVHHGLRVSAGVRALPLRAAVDFTIVRLAATERACATNVSVAASLPAFPEPQWGDGMQSRLCPVRGQVACKWASLRCSVDTPRST
jgi:hypothetical protein